MEALLEVLRELHPEVDFETCDTLLDDEILDSDDLTVLLDAIARDYDVQVPQEEINAENFNSAETIYDLIESLQDED
ncbi:MAG: acyl carrier protein [Lachnospiraceae bacterium]|nr:acyl carrier protein [Lachnospiraceae bacterium]MCD8125096.1 acyl carrier protein [Lachnospiraceae bacterium]